MFEAFNYALVASEIGTDTLHTYVGQEPSGRLFNDICLDTNGKPHNPMVSSGGIVVCNLMKHDLVMADRFDYVLTEYKKMAGGEYIGFNNATFLSEREAADRNNALAYYMCEMKCFPEEKPKIRDILDFYFQLCSLEATCESAAVMAATLANGGQCPLTGEHCIGNRPCRDVLSLMYSCGMYDYSGQFAFQIGLPAKSGVSGALIVVVPNVMGICLWSPPLDKLGNSARGVKFCKELIEAFNFHNYDTLSHTETQKLDPRKRPGDSNAEQVILLLFAARNGDISAIRRFHSQGVSMVLADYDGRTTLHLAASEGYAHLVQFLLRVCKLAPDIKDRWGRTPLEDARNFGHTACVHILERYAKQQKRKHQQQEAAGREMSCISEELLSSDCSSGAALPTDDDDDDDDDDDGDYDDEGIGESSHGDSSTRTR